MSESRGKRLLALALGRKFLNTDTENEAVEKKLYELRPGKTVNYKYDSEFNVDISTPTSPFALSSSDSSFGFTASLEDNDSSDSEDLSHHHRCKTQQQSKVDDKDVFKQSSINNSVSVLNDDNSGSICSDSEKSDLVVDSEIPLVNKDNEPCNEELMRSTQVESNKNTTIDTCVVNIDRVLVNFGNITKQQRNNEAVEHMGTVRSWTKTTYCPYCFKEITHFPRHLTRNHKEEGAVRELLNQTSKQCKQMLLNALRRQGNYYFTENLKLVRPVRRPKEHVYKNRDDGRENYVACADCFGYFKREYLRRHRKNCSMRTDKNKLRENHLSQAQMMITCSGNYAKFYNGLRLKQEVFTIMRADEISKVAMNDILICSYAEELLGKHKRTQIKTVISNKMRELGRLLLQLRKTTSAQRMLDVLQPEFFDTIVAATKVISGYDPITKTYKASSLALHMGTTLRQICDTATKAIIKKCAFLQCSQPDVYLKNIKRLRGLLVSHWNTDISSLALKTLNENQWEKPKMIPLTSDIIKFQNYTLLEAKKAYENIQQRNELHHEYCMLSENVLALTVLLNRKRIGEVQYLTVKAYNSQEIDTQQQEFYESLSESEKILTRNFKRVVTGGKGSKPVAILFSKELQKYVDVLLSIRDECVPSTNTYLFANPKTENRWISGYHTLKKLAEQSNMQNKNLFTSTRLRKQIATILQVLNVSDNEMEQFANFMGHTKKTHEGYYRLPQSVYQTAKVSKLLLAINKGKGAVYRGKSLEEIEFSDNVGSDTDTEPTSGEKEEERHEEQIFCNTTEITSKHKQRKPDTETLINPIASTSKRSQNLNPASESSVDKNIHNDFLNNKSKPKLQRIRWTEEQKAVMNTYFKEHIQYKRPPKKNEVEDLITKNKTIFREKNWVKVKAYVYNCYK